MLTGHGSFPPTECIPDTVNGAKFIRDLYEMSKDTGGVTSAASISECNCKLDPL